MSNNWNEIKWIFEPDGTLRDLYVQDAKIEDWKNLVDFLNENYILKFGPSVGDEVDEKIDKDYVIRFWNDETGELELRTASVIIDNITINTHFFSDEEIEFDIDPSEINSEKDFEKVLIFMNNISRALHKPIILTGENQVNFPLVIVDFSKDIIKVLSKSEAEKLWK